MSGIYGFIGIDAKDLLNEMGPMLSHRGAINCKASFENHVHLGQWRSNSANVDFLLTNETESLVLLEDAQI